MIFSAVFFFILFGVDGILADTSVTDTIAFFTYKETWDITDTAEESNVTLHTGCPEKTLECMDKCLEDLEEFVITCTFPAESRGDNHERSVFHCVGHRTRRHQECTQRCRNQPVNSEKNGMACEWCNNYGPRCFQKRGIIPNHCTTICQSLGCRELLSASVTLSILPDDYTGDVQSLTMKYDVTPSTLNPADVTDNPDACSEEFDNCMHRCQEHLESWLVTTTDSANLPLNSPSRIPPPQDLKYIAMNIRGTARTCFKKCRGLKQLSRQTTKPEACSKCKDTWCGAGGDCCAVIGSYSQAACYGMGCC